MAIMVAPLHQVDVLSTLPIAVLVTHPLNPTLLVTTYYLLTRLLPHCTRKNIRFTSNTFSRKNTRRKIINSIYNGEK